MKEEFQIDTCYRSVATCCAGFKLNGTKCVGRCSLFLWQ